MHKPSKSTIDPKGFFYFSNGTGRDTYILQDNGGFGKSRFSSSTTMNENKEKRSFNFSLKNQNQSNGNRFGFKTNHYHSDGTGRDQYIVVNEGGNSVNNPVRNVTNQAFQLRNYPQSIRTCANDHYQNSQRPYKTNVVANSILLQRQFDLTQSLSQPKKYFEQNQSLLKSVENKGSLYQKIQNQSQIQNQDQNQNQNSRYQKEKPEQIHI